MDRHTGRPRLKQNSLSRDEPTKRKNPAKLNVLRGSADGFVSLRDQEITRPGLEENASDAGETPDSENGGHSGGHSESESETVARLRAKALADLTQALASFQAWQSVEKNLPGGSLVDEIRVTLAHLTQS